MTSYEPIKRTCEPHQSFTWIALGCVHRAPIKELAVPRLHQGGFVGVRRAVKGGLRSNFSAISTSRRSASEREGLSGWRLAHASTSAVNAGGARKASIGSLPVAGRPRFLGITFLLDTLAIARYYLKFAGR